LLQSSIHLPIQIRNTAKYLQNKVDLIGNAPYYPLSSGAGWSSLAARRAHNPKVAGSNPAPATKDTAEVCRLRCMAQYDTSGAGWSSLAARRAHNPKVVGSNPTPATNQNKALHELHVRPFLFLVSV
jgi:hypothetical protein